MLLLLKYHTLYCWYAFESGSLSPVDSLTCKSLTTHSPTESLRDLHQLLPQLCASELGQILGANVGWYHRFRLFPLPQNTEPLLLDCNVSTTWVCASFNIIVLFAKTVCSAVLLLGPPFAHVHSNARSREGERCYENLPLRRTLREREAPSGVVGTFGRSGSVARW